MQYVIAGVCVILCVAVLVFGFKTLKETRSMSPRQPLREEEEDEIRRLRP